MKYQHSSTKICVLYVGEIGTHMNQCKCGHPEHAHWNKLYCMYGFDKNVDDVCLCTSYQTTK